MFRHRRKKSLPYNRQGQYEISYLALLGADGRKRTSSSRREAGKRRVRATGSDCWLVSGGNCEHTVVRQNGRLVCVDHEPEHTRHDGQACCHEIAVYKFIAWDYIPTLFDSDGFRIKGAMVA